MWRKWTKGPWVVAVVALMALGSLQAGSVFTSTHSPATPSASSDLASAPATPASVSSPPSTPAAVAPSASGPHPGTLEIYNVFPGGATTEDPAVAYDTVSYEPILNTLETLITYNGSSSSSYVPVLATCVPGTVQCTTDYGSTLIANNTHGQPTYFTFVLDPAAQFYDPSTAKSWGVYPTDVMFSIAREMAYSEAIGVGNTPGWLIAQALLPNGSGSWDGGIHAPYNTTPGQIYGSMFINDTTYCPAAALAAGQNGCITFNVSGQGGPWPFFLQLIGDGFMGVTPCGWYTFEGAGLPGWGNISTANGDGSCLLPDGGTTTQSSSWTTYLTGLSPTGWDDFEKNLGGTYPAPAPKIQWSMVGSGPYYSIITPSGSPPGYSLITNPKYAQPVGCSGAGGLATYGGYCWPAPGKYIGNVAIYYEPTDTVGIGQYKAGQADFAGILTTDTGELLSLASQGLLDYYTAHGLSVFFQQPNLNFSSSAYTTDGLPGTPNIPSDFFSGAAARGLMTTAVPYATAESRANTVDGIQYEANGGGPIVSGMTYYPTNVSYPYLGGNPTNNPSLVGSAAWWWHVGTTRGSGYYDPELAQCLNVTCVFPVIGENGAPNLDIEITLEINSIEAITSNHIQPYTYDLNFGGSNSLISYQLGGEGPGDAPLPYWNLGWAADNFAPEDYLIPMAFPDSTYTYGDAVYEQFQVPQYNDPTLCGHSTGNLANLTYWAKQPAINSSCEGVAYDIVNDFFYASTHEVNTSVQGYLYWAIQAILNDLNLYTWDGTANQVTSAAPWIDGSTINFNPTVGGGNDQFWFQVHYRTLYSVTVTESGLPSGTSWSATVGPKTVSSTSASITLPEMPNASYNYSVSFESGYSVTPSDGVITIAGSDLTQTVAYTSISAAKVATVTFNETGLVSNTTWSLVVTGFGVESTSSASLVFALPQNTKYAYTPQSVVGFLAPPVASVDVLTAPVNVSVPYTGFFSATYEVAFVQQGLPVGSSWSVTVGSGTSAYQQASTAATIVFYEANGSLPYTVASTGHTPTPSSGTVAIKGGNGIIAISFQKPTPTPSPAWTYLSPLAYSIIGALAVLTILGFALATRYARRKPPAEPPESWTGETGGTGSGEAGSSPPSGPAPPST